jgi:NADH dehydrogenase/NADH:ubiquinone oxidoreductase subunit G
LEFRDFRTDLRGQLESGFTQLESHLSGFANLRMLESSERTVRLADFSSSDSESGNNGNKFLVLTSSQHRGHESAGDLFPARRVYTDNMGQIVNINGENQTHLKPVWQSQEADADARLQLAVCRMLAEVISGN